VLAGREPAFGDSYIRITLFPAAVLFLVGIGGSLATLARLTGASLEVARVLACSGTLASLDQYHTVALLVHSCSVTMRQTDQVPC
jgi:hypothetical protein